MKIRKVSFNNTNPVNNRPVNYQKTPRLTCSSDSVSFGNTYEKELVNLATTPFTRMEDVILGFRKLFGIIDNNADIEKTKTYFMFREMYLKESLPELLTKFMYAGRGNEATNFVPLREFTSNVLALKSGQPIMSIQNNGKIRLRDVFSRSQTKPVQMEIRFNDKLDNYGVSFNSSPNGNLETCRNVGKRAVFTSFYGSTGKTKKIIEQYHDEHPEIMYFNKDGSVNKFKTWVLGAL